MTIGWEAGKLKVHFVPSHPCAAQILHCTSIEPLYQNCTYTAQIYLASTIYQFSCWCWCWSSVAGIWHTVVWDLVGGAPPGPPAWVWALILAPLSLFLLLINIIINIIINGIINAVNIWTLDLASFGIYIIVYSHKDIQAEERQCQIAWQSICIKAARKYLDQRFSTVSRAWDVVAWTNLTLAD